MKKQDTIALYREAYLEGKSDDARRKFDEKEINKQYQVIMTWKRRHGNAKADTSTSPATPAAIADTIRKMVKAVGDLPYLNEGDMHMLLEATDQLRNAIANYEINKLDRQLAELTSSRDDIQNRINQLENQLRERRGY
jgi:RNA processing factor Prp31